MLANQLNKQNNNTSSNGIKSRQFNKSKSNLLQMNFQGEYSAINGSFAENISLKIYQQRVKNRTLFDKIKEKVSGFRYELIVPVKYGDSQQVLIRQYGRLLEQNQFLQKEWSKIEFFLNAATERENSNYDFLIKVWQHRGLSEFSQSEEIIDRLNKTVLLMKRGIDSSIEAQKHQNSTNTKQSQTVKSDYCFEMEGKLEALKQLLQKRQKESANNKKIYDQKLLNIEQQNIQLKQKLSIAQKKLRDNLQKQRDLYQNINRMSKLIFQKEKALDQIKQKKNIYRRYVSESLDQKQDPFFEIIIKSKTLSQSANQIVQPIVLKMQLLQIENFLCNKRQQSLLYSFQFINDEKSISDVSQESSVSISESNVNDIAGLIADLNENVGESHFSSTKKRQRIRNSQLSNSKFISNRKVLDQENGMRQMKFIRRK